MRPALHQLLLRLLARQVFAAGRLRGYQARRRGSGFEFACELCCPPLTLVELPRIKLAFEARAGHRGDVRLYSLDHSDLFITNDRHPMVNKMLLGIPHSLLLANLKGETSVLVPVLKVQRPPVISQPFSTMVVLDRTDAKWSSSLQSRYYMYPVHVSSSFLFTKGLNAGMYLLLLRLLSRSYDECYRLTDSVASDTALNAEGLCIFKNLKVANGDAHPDAHACRLKISLVTSDSGTASPWDCRGT